MNRKISELRPLIVMAVVIVAAIGLRTKHYLDERKPVMADITVAEHVFRAEIANTPAKRELGLGKRDVLAPDAAMYFPMGGPSRWIFWMKDMRLPIDIIWISDGKVVDVSANVPIPTNGQELATYSPIAPADAVLEINAGLSAAYGITRGADVQLRIQR